MTLHDMRERICPLPLLAGGGEREKQLDIKFMLLQRITAPNFLSRALKNRPSLLLVTLFFPSSHDPLQRPYPVLPAARSPYYCR